MLLKPIRPVQSNIIEKNVLRSHFEQGYRRAAATPSGRYVFARSAALPCFFCLLFSFTKPTVPISKQLGLTKRGTIRQI